MKRIIKIKKYISPYVEEWDSFNIGISATKENMKKIDFSKEYFSITPSTDNWLNCKYNIYWKEIVLKNMEKEYRDIEVYYRLVDYQWNINEGVSTRTILAYPKKKIYWYNFELILEWDKILINNNFKFNEAEEDKIKLALNMLIEIFWDYEIINKNNTKKIKKVTRVNFEILPKWEEWKRKLREILKIKEKSRNWKILTNRFNTIEEHFDFEERYEWKNQFQWYIGFRQKWSDFVILENDVYWNAIYIFKESLWKEHARKTKKEILEWNFHEKKIEHKKWYLLELAKFIDIKK